MPSLPLSIVMITYNEERNLPACLASLRGLDAPLLVVDTGSTDSTLDLLRAAGAHVATHPFETPAKQYAWGLENLPIRTPWVLALDADHRLTPGLRDEIRALFRQHPDGRLPSEGYYCGRRYILRGRWLRHGDLYPKYVIRLFRRDKVFVDPAELVDQHFYVRGPTGFLENDLVEDNFRDGDPAHWEAKNRHRAPLEAREEFLRQRMPHTGGPMPRLLGSPYERLIWQKMVWRKLPRYVRPVLYFAYRYVFRRGFLDGREGLMFHYLQALKLRLLVDRSLGQLRREARRAFRAAGRSAGPREP